MLIKLIHGFTGRKAGEVPGYDSKENGVLDIDELYGIITKFFIDEYPSLRHMGIGMGGRRPAVVIEELNETRNLFKLMDEDQRRIHLGWKIRVTPNDEGVCVFQDSGSTRINYRKKSTITPEKSPSSSIQKTSMKQLR